MVPSGWILMNLLSRWVFLFPANYSSSQDVNYCSLSTSPGILSKYPRYPLLKLNHKNLARDFLTMSVWEDKMHFECGKKLCRTQTFLLACIWNRTQTMWCTFWQITTMCGNRTCVWLENEYTKLIQDFLIWGTVISDEALTVFYPNASFCVLAIWCGVLKVKKINTN